MSVVDIASVGPSPGRAGERGGRIDIRFARSPDGDTHLQRQFASYPFHLCRTLRFPRDPPGMATLYLQSCSGGIFEHDRLSASIVAVEGAQAHVTTQASTIVHGMPAGEARQETHLEAHADALLELLADPLILFPSARLTSRLRIRVHDSARVIVGDSFLQHDPGGGHGVFEWLDSGVELEGPSGDVLARDRFRIEGEVLRAGIPGITGRYPAQGTLLVMDRARPTGVLVDALRHSVASLADVYAGASSLPGECGAWMRLLAVDGAALRRGMAAAWSSAREAMTGVRPAPRRK